mgnify:FL=1|jgi:hypothetical protein
MLALKNVFSNKIFCRKNRDKCRKNNKLLKNFNHNLVPPTTIKKKYDPILSKFCINLLGNFNFCYYKDKKPKLFQNAKKLDTIYYNNKILGYLLTNGEESDGVYENCWLVFRGTDNKHIDELLSDIYLKQAGFADNSIKWANKNLNKVDIPNVRCHQGFLDIYNAIKTQLVNIIAKRKFKNLIVTGYSLGAAISSLVSVDFALSDFKIYTYVYASPRVGNENFANLVEYLVQNSYIECFYRISNTFDFFTNWPAQIVPNISEVTKPYYYVHCGEERNFSDNRYSIRFNHDMNTYKDNI